MEIGKELSENKWHLVESVAEGNRYRLGGEIMPSSPRMLSEAEERWLLENGGSGEGIILYASPLYGLGDDIHQMYTTGYNKGSERYAEYVEGRITTKDSSPNLLGHSLLSDCPPSIHRPPWPSFLWPVSMHVNALIGVHVKDFEGIYRFVRKEDQQLFAPYVVPNAVNTLDVLKVISPYVQSQGNPSSERTVLVKTKDGERKLFVSDQWKQRLVNKFPIRSDSWNDILGIIEEK